MINSSQREEIRKYLLDKMLPLDLMMEVEDHFITQINEYQSSEKLSFDEAFNRAIISWYDDLKLSWDGSWDLEDSSSFIRKSARARIFSLIKKSALMAAVSYLLIVAGYFVIPFDIFRIIIIAAILILIVFPLLVYIKHKKVFDFPRKIKEFRISFYQDLGSIFFTLPVTSIWVFRFLLEMNDHFLDMGHVKGLVFNSLLWLFLFFEILVIDIQQKYLGTLKRVIPYVRENF